MAYNWTKTNGQAVSAADMEAIEAAINLGLNVVTSSTRPSSPANGTTIYETDTGRVYIYNGGTWNLTPFGTARTAGCRLRMSAAQSIPNGGALVDFVFNVEDWDTHGFFPGSGTTITIPTGADGLYLVTTTFLGPVGWYNNLDYKTYVSSTPGTWIANSRQGNITDSASPPVTMIMNFSAGNTIKVQITNVVGSAQNFEASIVLARLSA